MYILKSKKRNRNNIKKCINKKMKNLDGVRTTSPHLTSPHLTSPHLTSPHLTSPHLTSPLLSSPLLSSPLLSSPLLSSPLLSSPLLSSPLLSSPLLSSPMNECDTTRPTCSLFDLLPHPFLLPQHHLFHTSKKKMEERGRGGEGERGRGGEEVRIQCNKKHKINRIGYLR